MPDPLKPLAELTNTYAAEDFMAQRKRLREARARWLEEHESPKPMTIEHTDELGSVIGRSAVGFFEVGRQTYDPVELLRKEPKPTFKPEPDNPTATKDLDELDEILAEAGTFMAPGIYRESPHPEMREGEDYGEYCARVGREYEAATGANAVRRPVPDSDSVREPAAADSSRERRTLGPGASPGERVGESVRGDAAPDRDGGARPGDDAGDREPERPPSAGAGSDRDPAG